MNPAIWGFIGALVGAIVGASSSILTTVINARNESNLQAKIEMIKKREHFNQFQRENLLRLQDILSDLGRLIGRAYLEDLQHFRQTGKWRDNLLASELDEDLRVMFRDTSILIERINNDDLRNDIKVYLTELKDSMFANSKEGADRLLQIALDNFKELMTKIGFELRKTYEVI